MPSSDSAGAVCERLMKWVEEVLCDDWEALGSGDGMKRVFRLYRRELERFGGAFSFDRL